MECSVRIFYTYGWMRLSQRHMKRNSRGLAFPFHTIMGMVWRSTHENDGYFRSHGEKFGRELIERGKIDMQNVSMKYERDLGREKTE